MILFLIIFYLGVSTLFAAYILFKSTRENPVHSVAEAAAVLLIWPILAMIYLIGELTDFAEEDVTDGGDR